MDCVCYRGVTKTALPVCWEKDALVLEDTVGLPALGSRLALYAADCLVSSVPKQGHLRAGERMRSVFLLGTTLLWFLLTNSSRRSKILSCLRIRVRLSLWAASHCEEIWWWFMKPSRKRHKCERLSFDTDISLPKSMFAEFWWRCSFEKACLDMKGFHRQRNLWELF